jgi:hypothetical protein
MMAAAIIPLVSAAVSAIGPQIPSIVQMVEELFGHSSQTGQKEGDAKMQAAVSIGSTAFQQLANSGKVPSAPVVDPSLSAGLTGAIQQVMDSLQKLGQLRAAGSPPAPSVSTALNPAPRAAAANSAGWTFSGTLTSK